MVIVPPLSPPAIVFPIVWGILFALMGIGAARIYLAPTSGARSRSLLLFLIQLIFNFFWSIIFFNFQAYGFAFIWLLILWFLILLMILSFRKVDKLAAWLQLPYLLWVTFAAYLNFGVWLLNKWMLITLLHCLDYYFGKRLEWPETVTTQRLPFFLYSLSEIVQNRWND